MQPFAIRINRARGLKIRLLVRAEGRIPKATFIDERFLQCGIASIEPDAQRRIRGQRFPNVR
jgi:hypothetical protein